jgi:ABC-type multidrug transport system ATPase subunit
MIVLRGVGVEIGDRWVLEELDLTLPRHRISAIVGPGGAGKSTLLRLLGGELPPAACAVGVIDGMPARRYLVPQRLWSGPGRLTARVVAGLRTPAELVRAVWRDEPIAERLLLAALDRPLAELSRSVVRLAMLTAALAEEPELLLLDEPDVDLVDIAGDWLIGRLRDLSGAITVVVVSHHLRFVRCLADEVTLLVGGRLVESASRRRFFEAPVHPRTRDYVRLGS